MSDKNLRPLSLIQHFDAPTDYRGSFGWMCGYSADQTFLNEAAERFTRETHGGRAHRGSISLALFLDPSHPAIGLVDVPGVAHLPLLSVSDRPFRLMHAKIALLGFRHESGDGRWLLRLIVSTGNWTRQTVEDSLDLAWCIEVQSDEVDSGVDDVQLRCADAASAWDLMMFLQARFDLRLLEASGSHNYSETAVARTSFASWIQQCKANAGGSTRFVDNRRRSLLHQLSPKVKEVAGGAKRNYLAMGSGFFESSPSSGDEMVPPVLDALVSLLVEDSLISKSGVIDVFVNPAGCQAVARGINAILDADWTVRPASKMEDVFGPNSQRTLHAKFLFSARLQENSNVCNSAWVYLGSGNLTGPGFANAMSSHGGNLEAGVIFSPGELMRHQDGKSSGAPALTDALPIQWSTKYQRGDVLDAGSEMLHRTGIFIAPPVPWLTWVAASIGGYLKVDSAPTIDFSVRDAADNACEYSENGFVWPDEKPRQVRIQWRDDEEMRECLVPVMDEFGRLAATELVRLNFEDAWSALLAFPAMANNDEDSAEGEGALPLLVGNWSNAADSTYPIRQMMELIENVAAKQTEIGTADWAAWCARLEQTLSLVSESPILSYFVDFKLNALSPLRAAAFRPTFAETSETPEGAMYEGVLDRIENKWKFEKLFEIGGGVR